MANDRQDMVDELHDFATSLGMKQSSEKSFAAHAIYGRVCNENNAGQPASTHHSAAVLVSCDDAQTEAHLNLQDDVVASVSKSHRSKRIEYTKDAVGFGVAIEVVHSVWLPAHIDGASKGNG